MNCPGCGDQLAEGSKYCRNCGGKIEGSTIDYSQNKTLSSEYNEDDLSSRHESMNELEENFVNTGYVRFAIALVLSPIIAFVLIFSGIVEKRADYLGLGVFFAVITIVGARAYYRYTRDTGPSDETEPEQVQPRYLRRV